MTCRRDTVGVKNEYRRLVKIFGNEFEILLSTPVDDIRNNAQERIAEGVEKVRRGDLIINPGYDGEFGTVRIFCEDKPKESQLGLF